MAAPFRVEMRRSVAVPIVNESLRADGETVVDGGIPCFQDVSRRLGLLGIVDRPELDDLSAGPRQASGDRLDIAA